MTRALALLAAAVLLTGCDTLGTPPPQSRPLDLALTRRCADPVAVPDRDLTESEVAALWGRDRIELRDCGRRLEATTRITEQRDAELAAR